MNSEQTQAFNLIEGGHNVYIGGQAGCGKSYVVREVLKWAEKNGKTASITCTTGIACCVYEQGLDPMTIHKWSGIGDCRFSGQEMQRLLQDDDIYTSARQRILSTDLLVIDEISMLSLKSFDLLNNLMRSLKNPKFEFGGTQIILVGDFLQLPPVRNARYEDSGLFCFTSEHFPSHKVFLSTVVRQSDEELSSIIHSLSLGHNIESHVFDYIRDLSRRLEYETDKETVHLFACNTLVDIFNRDSILQLRGQLFSFDAIDEGKDKYLNTLIVPKTLWIKEGAKVMLLRNLSTQLVNGLRGRVLKVKDGEVVVYFPSINQMSTIQKINFTVFDPSSQRNLAVRSQIPLKLCYAMTIHKAQGMTLDRVVVDCRNIFQPGQLAVAMGRVRSASGLRVINFSRSSIIPQPSSVLDFLKVETTETVGDMSCCHHGATEVIMDTVMDVSTSIPSIDVSCMDCDVDAVSTEFEFDGDDDDIIKVLQLVDISEFISQQPTISLPDEVDTEKVLNSSLIPDATNKHQIDINKQVKYLQDNMDRVNEFCANQYSVLSRMYDDKIKPTSKNTVPQSQLTAFMGSYNEYVISDVYQSQCLNLFESEHVGVDSCFYISYEIMSYLRKVLMAKKTENLPCSEFYGLSCRSKENNLSDAARGKIRYIAGYVIAKLHYKLCSRVKALLYKTSSRDVTV